MSKEIEAALISEAESLGLESISVDRSKRHPRIAACVRGSVYFYYVFPSTPSDFRSLRNCVAGFRRLVRRLCESKGVLPAKRGPSAGSGAKRRHRRAHRSEKRPSGSAPSPEKSLTRLDRDPWSELAKLRELLVAARNASTEKPSNEPNLLYAGAAERARRNGQW